VATPRSIPAKRDPSDGRSDKRLGREPDDADDLPPPRSRRRLRDLLPKRLSIPATVALVFGACTAIAIAIIGIVANLFENELGIGRWVFVAVPSLFGALFAVLIYQGAERTVRSIRDALSRSLLVALVTWIAVGALATAVWCVPSQYGACLGKSLLLTGLVGGGPLLLATLVAGAIGGYIIIRRPRAARKIDGVN